VLPAHIPDQKVIEAKKQIDTNVQQAIEENNLEQIKQILKTKETASAPFITEKNTGLTPLIIATRMARKEIINYLIELKVSPNQQAPFGPWKEATALYIAAQTGKTEIVKQLAENGAKADKIVQGSAAIHAAAENNDINTIKLLIELGEDINRLSKDNESVIINALTGGYKQKKEPIIQELIDLQAEVDKPEKHGVTPLLIAILYKDAKSIEILTNAGAKIPDDTKHITYNEDLTDEQLKKRENMYELFAKLIKQKYNTKEKIETAIQPLQQQADLHND